MKNFVSWLFVVLLFFTLFGCDNSQKRINSPYIYNSYIEVPGITKEEISAIEALQEKYAGDHLIYGMPVTTEAYENEFGEISGFSVLFCNWLTELFGISFKPVLYDWLDLIDGMAAEEVSFSGELTSTEARRQIYHMTSAIASRPVKGFRLSGSRSLAEIASERLVKCGFMEGAATINAVTSELVPNTFEIVTITDFNNVYDALKNGMFDVFYYSGVAEISFLEYNDITAHEFFPLIFMPVSFSTRIDEMEPIISVVEKILENRGLRYLTTLYNEAHQDYLRYKLRMRLSAEEREYIKNNPVILMGADPANYPSSFFEKRLGSWEGICMDVLDEVSSLTGLTFNIVSDENSNWLDVLEMLENGDVSIVPELAQIPERAGRFIWPNTAQMTDYYALISKMEYPEIKVNEVIYIKVGIVKNTVLGDIFKKWFPNHLNTVEYDSMEEAFDALQKGEVEMVMANQKRLLYLTHYMEIPNYKTNVVFDYAVDIKFGFNKDEVLLCSIFDKALAMINLNGISESWMRRTYDYRRKVAENLRPMFILLTASLLGILSLVVILFVRSRFAGKELQKLVFKRTDELEKQTAKIAHSFEYAKKLSDALAKITKSPAISAGILDEAANIIVKEGCIALNTHRIGVWSFADESEKTLRNISYYDTRTGEITVQDNYDLTHRGEYVKLLNTERLIAMNNIEECKLISTAIDDENYARLCAALDAPIRVDGKVVGVVCVEQSSCEEFYRKREWTMEEQSFTSSLADFMALAIYSFERHKAREAAETASQSKSAFLANMSHEIRTPMNAILGVTEILIQNEMLPPEIGEGLDKIYNSCDLLLGIINDILDFSKIEAGKLDIIPLQYKIASLINDTIHLNMMRIDSKPIEFELQIDGNIPAVLVGDELRIKQILNNLLSNAFKYTDAGKVILSVSTEPIPMLSYLPDHTMKGQVRWTGENEGTTLVFGVRDTGHGMTQDQLNHMFDEYSRFNQEKSITVEGTGLGLAITRRLISLMNGGMDVESEPGKGSLFTVLLPQETVNADVIGDEVAANLKQFRKNYITHRKRGQIVRDPMPYGKVLVVDDIETNLYVAVGLMKLYKLQITTAMSGQEAIDKIKEGNVYDVVFMDHMMPEMDGIETTKRIRSWEEEIAGGSENSLNESVEFPKETPSNNRDSPARIPIVALTANAVAGQADIFLQNGFDDFISKPIDIRQLNAVLNKFVRDKQPPDIIEAARKDNNYKTTAEPEADTLLLDSFIRDAQKTVTWLREQSSHFDNEEVIRKFTIITHGIKSSLWNIGETLLSGAAFNLEKAGREQDIEFIKTESPGFIDSMQVLLEKLEIKQTKYSESEDTAELYSKLNTIRDICSDYNRKGAIDVIAGIRIYTKETKIVLDKIMDHIIHSEFEEAQNAAEEYADVLRPGGKDK
ncbi:MAG: ATP-binding protein [Treponema sp.]|nr:ATP-binding protein [Treponema sp.]